MSSPDTRPIAHRRALHTRGRRIVAGIAAGLAVLLGVTAGIALYTYFDLSNGIHRSDIDMADGAPGFEQDMSEQNILIMGLDSRVDQNGKKLPDNVMAALHAGDASDGGYNANMLMLVHIPGDGSKATGISIPRDDYVDLVGAPSGVAKSKIKEAYGLALNQKLNELVKGGKSREAAYQEARSAGRQAQIATVSQFLGGVPINHFIEVTMAAFYEVAEAVQPITVCLNAKTGDGYSGADFQKGEQNINASQAMAFVRQRRDTENPGVNLTDFDRTRRQQAFIASVAYKLKQSDTFTNFGTLQKLIDTAKQYIALDSNFNLLSFAQQAAKLAGGNISFTTLPTTGFGTRDGKDVNLVDLNQIHATVKNLLSPSTSAPPTNEQNADSAPAASQAPASSSSAPSTGSAPATPDNVYSDWKSPLQSGAVPCVN